MCINSEDVVYQSLGGARVRYSEYWAPLMALAPLLNELDPGPNDGLVSVASARWGEYLGTLAFDHVEQVNFPLKVFDRQPMRPLWDHLATLATREHESPELPCALSLKHHGG